MRALGAISMKRIAVIVTVIVCTAVGEVGMPGAKTSTLAAEGRANRPISLLNVGTRSVQTGCPLIFSSKVVVAPNQPEVINQSTVGIINALCDVTLDFVGCGFNPTSVTLGCDTNGDGVSDLSIPLKDITLISPLLFQATVPALAATPGSAFPLACCGGVTTITLSRTVSAGDDNIFGGFTQSVTCTIDLGVRAPVVISATPAEIDCTQGQNFLMPGSCYVLSDGKPNVTSVFAIDAADASNVIHASQFEILSNNVIDASFQFGAANAGKTFLIYASGPNGTSRNLTSLPAGVPAGCPLGNEQGVPVSLTCKKSQPSGGPAPPFTTFVSCRLDRDSSGAFTMVLRSGGIPAGAVITVGGVVPKKTKFKDPDPAKPDFFTTVILKGRICDQLPGVIMATLPGRPEFSVPFSCAERCSASQ